MWFADKNVLSVFLAVQPVAETALYLPLSLTDSLQYLLLFNIKERPDIFERIFGHQQKQTTTPFDIL